MSDCRSGETCSGSQWKLDHISALAIRVISGGRLEGFPDSQASMAIRKGSG